MSNETDHPQETRVGRRFPVRPVVAILVIAAILTGGYYIDRNRKAKESLLSGYFESQPAIASSRIGGRVVKILIHEGDSVKAGQPLVQLEDTSFATNYESQKQAEEQARQQYLETARGSRPEEIAKARQAVAEAQWNYDKLRNGSRPEEVAAAQANADVALAKLQAAERGLTKEERAGLKARLDAALADEDNARKQLARTQFLYDQGAVPKQQLDTAISTAGQSSAHRRDAEETYRRAQLGTPKEELAQARQAYRQALAQLKLTREGSRKEDIEAARAHLGQLGSALEELTRGNRPEDIAKAHAAHMQAALQAKSTAENLREHVVSATSDANVDRILVADGDLLTANAPVVQLSNPADIWLRIYMPESELRRVKVGDDADLVLDGVDGIVKAVVETIATQGEFTPANLQSPEERGRQVFAVRLRLARSDPRVKAGMYATVRRVGQWP